VLGQKARLDAARDRLPSVQEEDFHRGIVLDRRLDESDGPIRWRGRLLGGVIIEGAYLYPVPATTP
jgi:hypothetical protein